MTQLLQTLLVEEPYLVKEFLASLLEYLILLLLFVLGRSPYCIDVFSLGWNLEGYLLSLFDLIETKRKMIRHNFKAAKLLHIELLSASCNLDMAMNHDLELTH